MILQAFFRRQNYFLKTSKSDFIHNLILYTSILICILNLTKTVEKGAKTRHLVINYWSVITASKCRI